VLRAAVELGEPLALSAITLIEIAVLLGKGHSRLLVSVQDLFAALEKGDGFEIVPIDAAVAAEVAALGGVLRDPADRTIVATARVHGLRLVTSDLRIIESKLAPVVE
jgi:PIN domain nuclease of toxin-antitoxin system